MQDQPLELYKAYVDDLVERSPGPYARWIMEKGRPETEEKSEQINLNGMDISFGGVAMAKEPFDTELYFDWVFRREGDDWPDPESAE